MNYQGQIGRQGSGRIFFRGLNASSSTAASSSKGSPFLDGIYFASSGQDIPFDYFERIEVMPGPQSALFGRAKVIKIGQDRPGLLAAEDRRYVRCEALRRRHVRCQRSAVGG